MSKYHYLYRAIIFVLMLFVFQSSQAQDEKLISTKKLKKDFEHFKKVMDVHPDPYRHYTKAEFDGFLKEAESQLGTPKSDLEFYKILSKVVAKVKDGHSSMIYSASGYKNKFKEFGVFPLEVYLDNNDEMFLIKAYMDDCPMKKGSQILEINGLSISEFIDKVDPYVSYEKKEWRNYRIGSSLGFMLDLVFGVKSSHVFKFSTHQAEEAEIQNISSEIWNEKWNKIYEEDNKRGSSVKPCEFEKLTDEVGMLTIYSFVTRDLESFKNMIRNTFSKIEKEGIKYLIMDVRGNGGGSPRLSSEILHYITEKHFKSIAKEKIKVSSLFRNKFRKQIPPQYRTMVRSTRNSYTMDVSQIMNAPVDSYIEEDDLFNQAPQTMPNEFAGLVFLLTDRRSFSASSCFASTFKCYQLGTILGEETGGTGIFHANSHYEKLKFSKFRVRMSTTKLYAPCYNEPDAGIKPDIEVIPSLLDRVNNVDSQLNYTLRIIDKIKKKEAAAKN